jgi:hypothetical protein
MRFVTALSAEVLFLRNRVSRRITNLRAGKWAFVSGLIVLILGTAAPNANPFNIRTLHGTQAELATKAELEKLLQQYDLSGLAFTHEVVIDERAIPHSHPVLTLHTRHLGNDDQLLSTYVHEQLHWFLNERQRDSERETARY